MIVGSLFSGIGGIDLGLERAGMRVAWQCEADAWCRRVLAKHWPGVPCYPDIRELGAGVERVDVLAGGFPCQPVSLAGKGLAQADERWLWPEFARLIRLLRPRYVLVENVPGLLARGMGDVLGDLAACGYDAEWDSIGAIDIGAPHRRKRIWVVAHAASSGRERRLQRVGSGGTGDRGRPDGLPHPQPTIGREGGAIASDGGGAGRARPVPDTDRARLEHLREGEARIFGHAGRHAAGDGGIAGGPAAEWWATEPAVGRVANGIPHRVDRLRGLGNAVVPQVVEWIGRRMIASEGVNG